MEREFGYREAGSEEPTLRGLLYRLFATDFCNGIHSTAASLAHFVIEARAKAAQASCSPAAGAPTWPTTAATTCCQAWWLTI